jgi:predicted PurR-regulated permease PerM
VWQRTCCRPGVTDRSPARAGSAEPNAQPARHILDLSWRSWWRLAGVVALCWLWFKLWELVLVLVVAAILAIALDPAVHWLERHRLGRGLATTLLMAAGTLIVVGLVALGWSSLTAQGTLVAERVGSAWHDATTRLPWLEGVAGSTSSGSGSGGGAGLRVAGSLAHALVVTVLALILTAYLLVDGRRTWAWLRAFVPPRHHARFDETAADVRCEVRAYVLGNIATSVFATVFVLVALGAMKVPGALVLALLAGVCDFIPVLGFVLSAAPAVLLALTVSTTTALVVVALYLAYHFIENYFIAPKVYGNQLKLSDVSVLLAFAAGAQLAGVVGALIALPIAAAYPTIERLWLRPHLPRGTVPEHARIEGDPSDRDRSRRQA